MESPDKLIRLDDMDNVLIARCDIKKGERILMENKEIEMKTDVKLGFKIAGKAIIPGEKIIKFRTPIGSATVPIEIGDVVHVHNMKSDYSPTYTIQNQSEYEGH